MPRGNDDKDVNVMDIRIQNIPRLVIDHVRREVLLSFIVEHWQLVSNK